MPNNYNATITAPNIETEAENKTEAERQAREWLRENLDAVQFRIMESQTGNLGDVDEVTIGEYRNIDDYIEQLEDAGFDADYENLASNYGFTAQIYVNGKKHALVDGSDTGHLVQDIQNPLKDINLSE